MTPRSIERLGQAHSKAVTVGRLGERSGPKGFEDRLLRLARAADLEEELGPILVHRCTLGEARSRLEHRERLVDLSGVGEQMGQHQKGRTVGRPPRKGVLRDLDGQRRSIAAALDVGAVEENPRIPRGEPLRFFVLRERGVEVPQQGEAGRSERGEGSPNAVSGRRMRGATRPKPVERGERAASEHEDVAILIRRLVVLGMASMRVEGERIAEPRRPELPEEPAGEHPLLHVHPRAKGTERFRCGVRVEVTTRLVERTYVGEDCPPFDLRCFLDLHPPNPFDAAAYDERVPENECRRRGERCQRSPEKRRARPPPRSGRSRSCPCGFFQRWMPTT